MRLVSSPSPLVPVLLLGLLSARSEAQVTIHVPADIATIQGAILAASNGDTVLVEPGVYLEHNINFLGKAIHLASVLGPEVTTIDAQVQGRGLILISGEGPGTVVEGFRIRNAYMASSQGAGIQISGSPVIRDCIVQDCRVGSGTNSSSTGGTGGQGTWGGGMSVHSGSPLVERCRFLNNRAGDGGQGGTGARGQDGAFLSPPTNGSQGGLGGSGGNGGGLLITGGSPLFVNVYFSGNVAGNGGRGGTGGRGGDGIAFQDGANGGRGGTGGSGGRGGAVYVVGGTPRFVHATLTANAPGGGGPGGFGGSRGLGGTGASNGSSGPGGSTGSAGSIGGLQGTASTLLQNSIAWANSSGQVLGASASSCDIQFGYPGSGNLNADPKLSGSQLLADSPCIDAGNDLWVPAGITDDLEDRPRVFDHPLVASLVPGSTVDMGCTEFVAAFALPYGCSAQGSPDLVAGTPAPGATLTFAIEDHDPRLGARGALLVGLARTTGCGVATNGGRLLVDLTQPYSLVLGHGVGPQEIELALPPEPALIGTSMFVQGVTLAPRAARPGMAPGRDPLFWSLMDALEIVIGP